MQDTSSTPKTEMPQSTQLRKAVFRGSRLLPVLLAMVVSFLSECEALGETVDLPFMAANLSYFDPGFSNSPALTANRRILRFTVPKDFRVISSSTNNYDPTGFINSIAMLGLTDRQTTTSRPIPDRPGASADGVVQVFSNIKMVAAGLGGRTLSETVTDSLDNGHQLFRPIPLAEPIKDVVIKFVIQGGTTPGKELTLKGKSGYGLKRTDVGWDGIQMTIALDWGATVFGPAAIVITFTVGAYAASNNETVLPVSDVASILLDNKPSALAYAQGVLDEYQDQVRTNSLRLLGAVPELLVLYDFSGTNTVLPQATIPMDAEFDENGTFKPLYRYINQFDSGVADGLRAHRGGTGSKGGDACGPTALRMALNTLGIEKMATSLYDNTMTTPRLPERAGINNFEWTETLRWLEGRKLGRDGTTAGLPAGTHAQELQGVGATAIATNWTHIDRLLKATNHHLVLLRTDLTGRTDTNRGGGHVILLLGKGQSDFVKDAYKLSGDYYVVADPAGHFFANTNGPHYGGIAGLMTNGVGINYGGWFGIYPVEKLRARIFNNSTDHNRDEFHALTIGSPFPQLRSDTHSPVAVVVTDPLGRRTGYQPDGSILEEIPDSWFNFASGDEEDGETVTHLDGTKTVLVNHPIPGLYQVELTGTGTGTFTLDWSGFDGVGTSMMQSITDTIVVGQRRTYQFTYGSPQPHLTIAKVGGQTVVSWPANTLGFVLQSTTDLGVSGTWNTVTTMPTTNGGQITVPATPSRPAEFFRLFKP